MWHLKTGSGLGNILGAKCTEQLVALLGDLLLQQRRDLGELAVAQVDAGQQLPGLMCLCSVFLNQPWEPGSGSEKPPPTA